MIALFTGARINAAITLQYKDIFIKDGIPCIQFRSDHPIKKLKNDASERLVPIHRQLLDLGFVDYINRQKARLKAKDTDFIIKKCQTKSGEYNNKFFTRELSPFLWILKLKPVITMALIFTLLEKILVSLCKIAVSARLISTISSVGKAKQPWNNLIPTIHLHKLMMK